MRNSHFILYMLSGLVVSTVAHALLSNFLAGRHEPILMEQQRNVATIEGYLYRSEPPAIVAVGSSMTEPLAFPFSDAYSIGVRARGPLTGLELLRRRGDFPKVLLIEVDSIHRALDEELLSKTVSSMLYPLRRRFAFLRSVNNPARLFSRGLLLGEDLAKSLLGIGHPRGPAEPQETAAKEANTGQVYTPLIPPQSDWPKPRRRSKFALPPLDRAELTKNISLLKWYVDSVFIPSGTTVFFYYVPTVRRSDSPAEGEIALEAFRQAFPADRYTLLVDPCPTCYGYMKDRIHLDSVGAVKFANFVADELMTRNSYLASRRIISK